ncbi:cupin [Williamsia sp.]|uniref:cupin n=1 Tax=Williamsia sp. TaxID=1872085 RepID=UPI002F939ADA
MDITTSTLEVLADKHLALAHDDAHGRSAEMLVRDGPLRQTLVAMVSGSELREHNSPPAASLLVLRGSVTVVAEGADVVLKSGEFRGLPHHRHSVTAIEDSVFILTTVTGTGEPSRR